MSERPMPESRVMWSELNLPPRIAVDAGGYYWREVPADEEVGVPAMWSMCPTNPDNSPIPKPLTYYVLEAESTDLLRRVAEALGELMQAVPNGGGLSLETNRPSALLVAYDRARSILAEVNLRLAKSSHDATSGDPEAHQIQERVK